MSKDTKLFVKVLKQLKFDLEKEQKEMYNLLDKAGSQGFPGEGTPLRNILLAEGKARGLKSAIGRIDDTIRGLS